MRPLEPQGWKKIAVRIAGLAVVVVGSLVLGIAIGNNWSRRAPWEGPIIELWAKRITDRQCVHSALEAYEKATSPFIRELPLTIEEIVDKRRIQEHFCLEFIKCFSNLTPVPDWSFAFDFCLNHNVLANYKDLAQE